VGESSSDPIAIKIFLIGCGQGDTILINVSRAAPRSEHWILVDCYLKKREGVRKKFFDFVEEHEIRRLDLIVQTHADLDHFFGMDQVLRHFTSGDRSLGRYVDGGLDPKQARAIMVDRQAHSRYVELQNTINELMDANLVEVRGFGPETEPIGLASDATSVEIVPLFPTSKKARIEAWKQVLRVGQNQKTKLDSNALAIIMAIKVQAPGGRFHALFTSDADAESVREALSLWARLAAGSGPGDGFDVVKVPHHGSIRSHTPELAGAGLHVVQSPIAAITCGEGAVLPDRFVLNGLLSANWRVLATTTRRLLGGDGTRKRRNHPTDISGRGKKHDLIYFEWDLEITWSPGNGLTADPKDAHIFIGDAHHYGTAQ
jgi:beta-lactamase superfamily II metal-dependent hydrolase